MSKAYYSLFFGMLSLSGITNSFRTKTLGLAPLSPRSGPSVIDRLKIPYTYCWSDSLIKNDLAAFLNAGQPPIYIGFGSVPVSDSKAMTKIIFAAVEMSGVRALVSAGWGGLGGEEVPEGVFILGNVPHDWLFKKVSAVVHHGGAGTTAIGLLHGRPTVVVPFFGDQQFWGDMVAKAGGGPKPISSKKLNGDSLAEAIKFCLTEPAQKAARRMGEQIRTEDGVQGGVDSFHRHLPLEVMRCAIEPSLIAVWWSDALALRLSGFAAQTLADAGKIDLRTLAPARPKEYDSSKQVTDPSTGGGADVLTLVENNHVGLQTILVNPPKGSFNTATAIPKGILNIMGSIEKGLYNLSTTHRSEIRTASKVVKLGKGAMEGAKELIHGHCEGLAGRLRDPIEGGQQGGLVGAIKGLGRSFINDNIQPAAGPIGPVTHDEAWSSKSLWARKSVSAIRKTRIEDGLQAFQASSFADRERVLATFAELDKHTNERRKTLEDRAMAIMEEGRSIRREVGEKDEKQGQSLTPKDEDKGDGWEERKRKALLTLRKGQAKDAIAKQHQKPSEEEHLDFWRQLAIAEQMTEHEPVKTKTPPVLPPR